VRNAHDACAERAHAMRFRYLQAYRKMLALLFGLLLIQCLIRGGNVTHAVN
jgi:hypothetical protein